MKCNLLYTAVAFVGLTGIVSAQGYQRQVPGYTHPGARADTVTAPQLSQWMQSATGASTATVDKWCYAMGQVAGGYTCPDPESFGFTGNYRYSMVDAQTFLNNLRAYQSGGYPGGYTAPYAATGPAGNSPGMEACGQAVSDRLRNEGYSDVRISSMNAEDRPGGLDRVYGSADAEGQYRRHERFDFSCRVNLERGEVHSVDVNPR